jgi:hypothetical protein
MTFADILPPLLFEGKVRSGSENDYVSVVTPNSKTIRDIGRHGHRQEHFWHYNIKNITIIKTFIGAMDTTATKGIKTWQEHSIFDDIPDKR